MRKACVFVASLCLCLGVVACENGDDDVDMGVVASNDSTSCCAKDTNAVEANPGVMSSEECSAAKKSSCSAAKSECSAKN
ncbi:MAG: hypothetical protein ACF8PN_14295 [Phycisphaerales bacterium]